MSNDGASHLSRRRFIVVASLGAAGVAFAPRLVFAQQKGIVPTMIDSAAKAKIETHTLPTHALAVTESAQAHFPPDGTIARKSAQVIGSKVRDAGALSRSMPMRTPRRFAPLSRRIPAAKSGLRRPLSEAS
jgi:hypothetical protein